MQTSSRPQDWPNGQRSKHVPQISISDDNHHVTDAISSLYGDQYSAKKDPRPLSFLASPREEIFTSGRPRAEQHRSPPLHSSRSAPTRRPLERKGSNEKQRLQQSQSQSQSHQQPNGNGAGTLWRRTSYGHEIGSPSPPLGGPVRSPAETATTSFPYSDLAYESSAEAVAQELSNLQALRRMSMDVTVGQDPDLPAFGSAFQMPNMAPRGDEDGVSNMFWVPARLHPELAPKEFKSFVDSRMESMKRRSGEYSLSPDGMNRAGSGGGLRRKKSMLSRQIDNAGGKAADGYQDGAERLDRKRSSADKSTLAPGISNLQDLEVLVSDPAKMIERLAVDTGRKSLESDSITEAEDRPLLPAIPANSLRRSTRTTYRRGSLRKGERVPGSRRNLKTPDGEHEEAPPVPQIILSTVGDIPEEPHPKPLMRVQTDPIPQREFDKSSANFSRPGRVDRRGVMAPPTPSKSPPPAQQPVLTPEPPVEPARETDTPHGPQSKPFVSQIARNGRSTIQHSGMVPLDDSNRPQSMPQPLHLTQQQRPERSASQQYSSGQQQQFLMGSSERGKRPGMARNQIDQLNQHNQTLKSMAANPSPLPGNSTRTDSMTFVPTLTDDRKEARKVSGKKEEKKSGWSWGSLLGKDGKEEEKAKAEEEDFRDSGKKNKRLGKASDNTRLDVLQQTMDNSRGRESLVLDRNQEKLEEERKKESTRKSSESKREKDSGLFSSLFGGGKKKAEGDSFRKRAQRALSPEPPRQPKRPDVDYNWTRFSILEERAIYRMAHIKLANPRRALHSQVLLSNFMYSYLAKVQQMHPQMQIPQGAAQRAQQQRQQQQTAEQQQQQAQQEQQRADQPVEFSQYQKYQEQLLRQDSEDQSRSLTSTTTTSSTHLTPDTANPYSSPSASDSHLNPGQQYTSDQFALTDPYHADNAYSSSAPYIDDAQNYEHDHGHDHGHGHSSSDQDYDHGYDDDDMHLDGHGHDGHGGSGYEEHDAGEYYGAGANGGYGIYEDVDERHGHGHGGVEYAAIGGQGQHGHDGGVGMGRGDGSAGRGVGAGYEYRRGGTGGGSHFDDDGDSGDDMW